MNTRFYIPASLIIFSCLVSFFLFLIDKSYSGRKDGKRRIPEKVLLLSAFCFGSLGAMLGMEIFRHKTGREKKIFTIGIPVAYLAQIAIIYFSRYSSRIEYIIGVAVYVLTCVLVSIFWKSKHAREKANAVRNGTLNNTKYTGSGSHNNYSGYSSANNFSSNYSYSNSQNYSQNYSQNHYSPHRLPEVPTYAQLKAMEAAGENLPQNAPGYYSPYRPPEVPAYAGPKAMDAAQNNPLQSTQSYDSSYRLPKTPTYEELKAMDSLQKNSRQQRSAK